MKRFYVLFATLLALNIYGPPVMYAQEGEVGEVGEDPIGDTEILNAIVIRDSNLSAAIRSTLGLATDATLTATNMLDLKSLQAKKAEISDLSGLEHATNLTTLNLYGNQLTDISPLSGIEGLLSLDLGKNTITDIEPLKALTALTTLHLDRNRVKDFGPLSSLTNLGVLHLSRTGISDLSALGSLTQLTQLYLTGNAISDIGALSGLTEMGWLFLAQNQMSNVSPLVGMEALVSLRLLENPVSNPSVLYGLTQRNLIDVDIEIPPPLADTDPPSVTIAVPSDPQKGAFDVTITFSEAVSGFEQADVTLSGTAVASITGWSSTDDTVFIATITPTTSGTVVLSVAADVATDAASNNNTAAIPKTVSVDMDSPDIRIFVPEGVQNGAFDVTIIFSESVSDFEQSDLSLSGTATVSITAWQGIYDTVFTTTLTPTTSGTVVLRIAEGTVTDTAGNTNVLSTAEVVIILNVTDAFVSVCDRTTDVRNAIVAALPNISDCAKVTAADLATIRYLDGLRREDITALKEGDFNGLTALEILDLSFNSLSSLPEGIFDELTALETLYLDDNDLGSLSSGVFDDLTALTELHLGDNDLSSLPSDIFEGLTALEILHLGSNDLGSLLSDIFDKNTALTELQLRSNDLSSLPSSIFDKNTALTDLDLQNNDLSSLPSGIFDKNTALTDLAMQYNDLGSLPSGIFDELTALTDLDLGGNDLGSLPSGIFDKLTALTVLNLRGNDLSSLPSSIFEGLTALENLYLSRNTVNPIPLTVSLRQIEEGQFKATVHTGAPPSLIVTVSVVNGSIDGGTHSITIPVGTVESETFTVTRTTGTTDAVVVDIRVLPQVSHYKGYEYVKSTDLPLTVIDALGNAAPSMIPVDEVPSETTLSANYPNPFNPETWIPYQLSNTSDVKITIYDARGRVVRVLDLGHQHAGYYTSRNRAAYWDGRNNRGERVASGLYFYHLRADTLSLLRKMVILK